MIPSLSHYTWHRDKARLAHIKERESCNKWCEGAHAISEVRCNFFPLCLDECWGHFWLWHASLKVEVNVSEKKKMDKQGKEVDWRERYFSQQMQCTQEVFFLSISPISSSHTTFPHVHRHTQLRVCCILYVRPHIQTNTRCKLRSPMHTHTCRHPGRSVLGQGCHIPS